MTRTLTSIVLALLLTLTGSFAQANSLSRTINQTLPKIVKIFGAGGFKGMEAYQSGTLISGQGHILTVWSHVLDTDEIVVLLNDGRRFEATLLGADPGREIAILKIDANDTPHFSLKQAANNIDAGTRVLAFSNLFKTATGNEPVSVQRGVVSVVTDLSARRGVFETIYRGPVYIVDAITNNPGAAGGSLVTFDGQWAGLIGKELRNNENDTWLNFAMPISELSNSVEKILSGEKTVSDLNTDRPKPENPTRISQLGVTLIPNVLPRTPPYLDQIAPNSIAAKAGLQPDDLIVFLGDRLIQSSDNLKEELSYTPNDQPIEMTVLRGGQLIVVKLAGR
ncbi:MAG: S1C family serine protease [Planctomycetia bacterium]|jgi:serine protease Do